MDVWRVVLEIKVMQCNLILVYEYSVGLEMDEDYIQEVFECVVVVCKEVVVVQCEVFEFRLDMVKFFNVFVKFWVVLEGIQ